MLNRNLLPFSFHSYGIFQYYGSIHLIPIFQLSILSLRIIHYCTNIVITDVPNEIIEGCVMAYSIEDAINKCDDSKENFIIGGASVYRQFMPYANKLYLTKVHKDFEGDCFFPEININEWNLISEEDCSSDKQNDFTYSYLIFEK